MKNATNIIALVPYPIFPAKMGGQKGIALFYDYLSVLLPVTLASTKNNQVPAAAPYQFIPVLGNSILRYINPLLFFRFFSLIKKNQFTHLVLEHPYFGWLAFLLKNATGIKLIVHSHNIEALRFKSTGRWWWPILWSYEKFIHRQADINFFITDEDRVFAVNNFTLHAHKCHTVTYGFEVAAATDWIKKDTAKKLLQQQYQLRPGQQILFFNGTLNYKPNLDAVEAILQQINPLLLADADYDYAIIICGKNLPDQYHNLAGHKNIIYAGFVADIATYFMGADIFINPVIDGGGIKTKLVEALGYNLSCVSTVSGAIGVAASITAEKMTIVPDADWGAFTRAIKQVNIKTDTPINFFNHFYWGNIAKKVVQVLADFNSKK